MLDITTRSGVVKEPQRNYLYYVTVEVGPTGSIQIGGSVLTVADLTKKMVAWTEVDCYNEEAFFPEKATDTIQQKWAGSSFFVSGTDASEKTGQLVFTDDEDGVMFEYWNICQQLTGTENVHAPSLGMFQNMQIGIAKVNVGKSKITSYARLCQVKVLSVKPSDMKKSDTGLSQVTVKLCWNWCEYDSKMRGKDIW